MRKLGLLVMLAMLSGASCGDDEGRVKTPDASTPPPAGPFDAVRLAHDIGAAGLDGAVHVARDEFGIMHISASTVGDLGFAQGYVTAHDRLPQMDILRRFGAGRLAELFGALSQDIVKRDLEMRVHRMRPLAEEAWATLQASTDAEDRKLVRLLQRYADGVNAYVADVKAGKWQIDEAFTSTFDPTRFAAWEPVDALVLGRFQAFALSYTAPVEVDLTDVYQAARTLFVDAPGSTAYQRARAGIASDILTITPVGRAATIDGFPNVAADSGSRADAGRGPTAQRTRTRRPRGPKQPRVPRELLEGARDFFARSTTPWGEGPVDPRSFVAPRAGSNNWVVGPTLAGGKALLAGDQHLSLPNPSIFYPVHLTVAGELDVEGITFPGIPGIVLGHNGKVAWTATTAYHDVSDVYLETIVPCSGGGGGDCVQHAGGQKPIEKWTEEIKVGALGTVTRSVMATYERVAHHGPFIPKIENGAIVPRTAGTALSVAYTGYQPSFEIRATWGLMHARTVDDGFKALGQFSCGAQNWVLIDDAQNFGWTTNAKVPLRKAAAYSWNAKTNPGGLAPFFVLPGDGSADWEGMMAPRYIPHAVNPAQGYLVTANSDPVGATFDGDPLNGPMVDGRPLYVGTTYAAGVRSDRITARLQAAAATGPVTLDALASIQHDSTSTMGRKLRDALVTALGALDGGTQAPDVAGYVAGLASGDAARLRVAKAKLAGWSFATPTAVAASATAAEIDDSAATSLFNVFMHYFIEEIFKDEFTAMNRSVWVLEENLIARSIYAVLVEPSKLTQSAGSGQPIVCDDDASGADQSCTVAVLRAMLKALDWLQSTEGFGSADPTMWRWGKKHTLSLHPLFPNEVLDVPATGGFAKPGDTFVVNRADAGWRDLDFRQDEDGPAQRFLAEAAPGQPIRARMALPGGVVFDPKSKHYRDLMDGYYLTESHFDIPFTVAEIVSHGEERWIFR